MEVEAGGIMMAEVVVVMVAVVDAIDRSLLLMTPVDWLWLDRISEGG